MADDISGIQIKSLTDEDEYINEQKLVIVTEEIRKRK